jgi:uridine kinase
MPETVSVVESIERVRGVRGSRTGTVLVAIDGHGGAGKSSLARRIRDALDDVTVICLDAFSRPTVTGTDWRRFMAQVLNPILSGRPGRYRQWDWDHDRPGGWQVVPTGGVVVVEGVGATRRELGHPWHLTIWVAAPTDLRLQRGVEREGEEMRAVWTDRWMPQEDAYVAEQRPDERADLRVDGAAPSSSPPSTIREEVGPLR